MCVMCSVFTNIVVIIGHTQFQARNLRASANGERSLALFVKLELVQVAA